MDFLKFLADNWSQVVVIIAALGYLIKIILDFNIKKREIKFEFIYKEKASAFREFLLSYQNLNAELTVKAYQLLYGNIKFSQFEKDITSLRNDLQGKLHIIYMYCTEKEKESLYSIINESTYIIYEVNKSNPGNVESVLLNFNKKNTEIINKIIKGFVL